MSEQGMKFPDKFPKETDPSQHFDRSNSSRENSLERSHAYAYLIECRNLAVKLAGQGMDIELSSQKDRHTLQGFEEVWLSGWLDDPDLQNEAGLTPAHIATLGYLLAQQQNLTNPYK